MNKQFRRGHCILILILYTLSEEVVYQLKIVKFFFSIWYVLLWWSIILLFYLVFYDAESKVTTVFLLNYSKLCDVVTN